MGEIHSKREYNDTVAARRAAAIINAARNGVSTWPVDCGSKQTQITARKQDDDTFKVSTIIVPRKRAANGTGWQ